MEKRESRESSVFPLQTGAGWEDEERKQFRTDKRQRETGQTT